MLVFRQLESVFDVSSFFSRLPRIPSILPLILERLLRSQGFHFPLLTTDAASGFWKLSWSFILLSNRAFEEAFSLLTSMFFVSSSSVVKASHQSLGSSSPLLSSFSSHGTSTVASPKTVVERHDCTTTNSVNWVWDAIYNCEKYF